MSNNYGDAKVYDSQSSFKKVTAKNSIRICSFPSRTTLTGHRQLRGTSTSTAQQSEKNANADTADTANT